MYGASSLNATLLRNRIVGSLRVSHQLIAAANVSQNFVFDHPTIRRLARAVSALVDPSLVLTSEKNRVEHVIDLIEKYSADLPGHVHKDSSNRLDLNVTVLVTGSTGNLGSHIVAALLSSERVSKVYTLDRTNAEALPLRRLEDTFKDRGLSLSLLSNGKLAALIGDFTAERFGLDVAVYEEVCQKFRGFTLNSFLRSVQISRATTHVMHNAWTVNFNHPLSSFEPQSQVPVAWSSS